MISKTKKTTTNETVSEKKETVFIYVGPTNKYISRYTTYRNGYPLHLKEQLKEFPILKNLFIQLSKLSEFERNVNEKGTAESIWFEEVKKYFNKEVSK
ncbi:hypothetical protein N4T77_02680 [Clostridium sp. CX1]|uniref:hypothetical protein n=1 Tax=Clostridium sp. CX1 TaxID=2978346 RepID=UPI0021BF746E|nr:hypothetical protein [Clostridium sp. CX1]MCT8975496.1 hypothetical protein [Clostridium sp. CX1]